MRVLIVDDSELVRERLAAMLCEVEGAEVVGQACDTREARKAIRDLQPDLVTLDIKLPGHSGFELLREIKGKGSRPTVIMLTNYPYEHYRKRCMDIGADYFFDKSTEFEQVAEVCGKLASRVSGGDQHA